MIYIPSLPLNSIVAEFLLSKYPNDTSAAVTPEILDGVFFIFVRNFDIDNQVSESAFLAQDTRIESIGR